MKSVSSFWIVKKFEKIKGALSSLRQVLVTENSLEMMKNAFYFTLKALLVLKIFKLLSWIFGHVEKRLDEKDKVNFKTYNITTWLISNCNTHIDQYLQYKANQAIKFVQLIEHKMRNIFLEKTYTKCSRDAITRIFSKKS